MRTYDDVAREEGLNAAMTARYTKYMRVRWPGTESQKCEDGYAREWAMRFRQGREYSASDTEGKAILTLLEAAKNW